MARRYVVIVEVYTPDKELDCTIGVELAAKSSRVASANALEMIKTAFPEMMEENPTLVVECTSRLRSDDTPANPRILQYKPEVFLGDGEKSTDIKPPKNLGTSKDKKKDDHIPIPFVSDKSKKDDDKEANKEDTPSSDKDKSKTKSNTYTYSAIKSPFTDETLDLIAEDKKVNEYKDSYTRVVGGN